MGSRPRIPPRESLCEFRVWKFPLGMPDESATSLAYMSPRSTPLSVGMQDEKMVVWALADFSGDNRDEYRHRQFVVVNTGTEFDLPDGATFLGTVTTNNGIVWHVWDGGWAL